MAVDTVGARIDGASIMTKDPFSYQLCAEKQPLLGLIVLQADETIEADFRRLMPETVQWLVSRVPSGTEVTSETLAEMENHLTSSAALFPDAAGFDAIGYGCTSGTAQIGAETIARLVRSGAQAQNVTEPVSGLVSACKALNLNRIALLSPYVEPVTNQLRLVLKDSNIESPVFGSFNIAEEAAVARIDQQSIVDAAVKLVDGANVDGLFLSCTNLRTLDVIDRLEDRLNLPVLSSNLVLAWHMLALAGVDAPKAAPGRLFRAIGP